MDPSDLELVRGVRATPSLFNPTNPDFKFAFRKEKIWVELSQYLGVNMNDARRRWTCLRDRYTRELKNRRLNPNMDHVNEEFFKEMDFLRPYVRKRKERGTIVCKIKSDTIWDGKLERHSYSTCDSSYLTKLDSTYNQTPEKINYFAKLESTHNQTPEKVSYMTKLQSTHDQTSEEVNVDEIFQEYQAEKADTVDMTMDSNNDLQEEFEEEAEDICETYQVVKYQMSNEGDVENSNQNYNIVEDEKVQEIQESSQKTSTPVSKTIESTETEDDFFCKSVCVYLRQLKRVHKIKAKVEMFKILQKYIEIEEAVNV